MTVRSAQKGNADRVLRYVAGKWVYMESGLAQIVSRFGDCLSLDAWQYSTSYALGDHVVPTTSTELKYECTVAGISAGFEPVWPATAGDTVADGSVIWTCQECVDVDMHYTADLIAALSELEPGGTGTSWLDWLFATGSNTMSDSRDYIDGMPSIAIPDSDTLESITYTNAGTHSGKALLLWQAMIGYSAMTREEYDGL